MVRRNRIRAALVFACATLLTTAAAAQDGQKTVLTLYPTRLNAPAAAALDRTLERALGQGLGDKLDYYAEYVDLVRFSDPGYQPMLRAFLRAKYEPRQLDLIIAVTDDVLAFVAPNRDDFFPGVPIVFHSTAGAAAGPLTTAVKFSTDYRSTVEIALRLQPDTQRIVVVSGASAWDKSYEIAARQQFKEFEGRLAFTYLSGLPMPELLRQVASLPAGTIIYYLNVTEDGNGTRGLPVDALDRLAAVASAPIYCWHAIAMDHGIVGGSLQSVARQAQGIAAQALRVLAGERPDAIPVADVNVNVIQFDWRQLRRWRIDESRLPPGSEILFRALSPWDQYRTYFLTGGLFLTLQTVTIVTLLFQRARRLRAIGEREKVEESLRENQKRYVLATAAGAVGVWDWNLDTNDIYVDPQLKRLLGYEDDEIENHLDAWGQRIHPDDRPRLMAIPQRCIASGTDTCEIEHRLLHKDGRLRWFLARATVMKRADGSAFRVIGTETDITERKRVEDALLENEAVLRASHQEIHHLAGRLIAAQENERTRIARDLHDDVSQQLAGLSIALSSLRKRTGAGGSDIQGEVTSLQQRTIALAENVRQLSHDLHPGVLQHAGLVAVLSAHCADLQRHQAAELTFSADGDFASIEADAALCLYRVAQEALRNAIKHAGARHVVVRLARSGSDAELTIADDGSGFDAGRTRRTTGGLGLVSITERVRLAGGTVSIVAELNKGTRVQVRIPVNHHPIERQHQAAV